MMHSIGSALFVISGYRARSRRFYKAVKLLRRSLHGLTEEMLASRIATADRGGVAPQRSRSPLFC